MYGPSGPGDWPVRWDATPASAKVPEADRPRLGQLAAAILWAASGRRFGLTTVTHTETRTQNPGDFCYGNPLGIELPGYVHDVIQVTANGATLSPGDYVLRGDWLIRKDGGLWPDHVVVTYRRGQAVPVGGDTAAAVVAAELHAAAKGGKCRLPARATSVSREGVEVALADPLDYLQSGLTGIAEVDTWIRAHNPYGLPQQPIVWSPDTDPLRSRFPRPPAGTARDPWVGLPRIGSTW